MQVTVTQLTDQLVASYARHGGINHLDGKNLPSKRAICTITVDLLRLLFPGFFDEKPIHSSEIKVETALLMDTVLEHLEDYFGFLRKLKTRATYKVFHIPLDLSVQTGFARGLMSPSGESRR